MQTTSSARGIGTIAKVNTTIAANVRRLRRERGWSQRELASKAGISFHAVQHAEHQHIGTIYTLQQLAAALGVEPWVLCR